MTYNTTHPAPFVDPPVHGTVSGLNAAIQLAQQILSGQGFLITCWFNGLSPLPHPGAAITLPMGVGREAVPGPFLCLGHATAEEYLRQVERFYPDKLAMARRTAGYADRFLKLVPVKPGAVGDRLTAAIYRLSIFWYFTILRRGRLAWVRGALEAMRVPRGTRG